MIRYPFIYNQVLQIYRDMEQIRFPIEPDNIISRFSNCRIRTYQQFAQTNGCSIRDVILLCESKSGCTHYDVANNRYLILWNSDNADNNVSGRKRWTKAHELGHVVLKHLPLVAEPMLAEHGFCPMETSDFEIEADQFAAPCFAQCRCLLCLKSNPHWISKECLAFPTRHPTTDGMNTSSGCGIGEKPHGRMT